MKIDKSLSWFIVALMLLGFACGGFFGFALGGGWS